jgi:predicted component of type VI protein secretion system
MNEDEMTVIKGRLLAYETILYHLVLAVAKTARNPDEALAALWREVENGTARYEPRLGLEESSIAEARSVIKRMGPNLRFELVAKIDP